VVLGIANAAGITVASVSSHDDGVKLAINSDGIGHATVVFPEIPLLKGEYSVTGIVACERAMHVYDIAERCIMLHVTQEGPAQGLVALPHSWGE
jgi:lipopolysaccharide transport system ATP-binding protein